ncbi:SDR family oxidoreductase [Mucilaginibacter pedocola]|uniref:Short-chain dehydrogenase/reductase n=1 Tax=Mucilaginibacter pedocola TaxID=1792845 RepID=A0A1S9PDE9_9SPHI|nr:SDR family oxidoreductase [Mucilaginibacter pedocola]OOQ58897.1 short-chain dehydrogenase/reductase [Mucilaginibacter pedocola]
MENKTIFITGASSGMGKATARYFHERDWNVIATMRDPGKEKELIHLENVTLLPLDVTDPKQIKNTVADAIATHPIDVVFNNAGYGLMGAMEALTDEQILKEINTNLIGVIRVTHEFIPHFRKRQSGVFISTTSMGGLLAFPLHSIYHAAKFGVQGWSEGMSYELGLHNIKIKTVAPGAVATDFLGRSLEKALHPAYKELEDKLFATTESMMSQGVSPERIAEVVYEAATDDKDQVTYIATDDAKAAYNRRLEIGSEASRIEIRKQILGR